MGRGILVGACMALGLTLSCVPKSGRLESNRFQHDRYPYAVFYAHENARDAPFGANWRVDNLASKHGASVISKKGDAYTVNRVYDLNDDGRGDFERLEARYDLLLENTSDNAAMWISTLPLSTRASEAPLTELATSYAAAMAAQGELAPNFGPENIAAAGSPAEVLKVANPRPCQLSKREALRANVLFAKGGEQRETTLVFVRTGYLERVNDGASGAGRYPVLMVIGLMAQAARRTALEPDLQALLDHTVLGDQGLGLSMRADHTCGLTAASEAAGGERAAQLPEGSQTATEPSPEDQLAPMPPDEEGAAPSNGPTAP